MRRALLLPLALLPLACGAPDDGATDATTAAEGSTSTAGDPTTGDPTTDAPTTTVDASTGAPATETGALTTSTDPGSTSAASDSSGDTSATTDATTGAAESLPPIDSVEVLEAWLAAGEYKQWAAESQVHPSTGPHGGNVRTYVNAIALDSLAAANLEHPQDAATVKELYGAGVDTIIGYAVSRKTTPTSQGGATWYWYERINDTTYGGDLGVGLCTGCHGGGADYILTPYPLQ